MSKLYLNRMFMVKILFLFHYSRELFLQLLAAVIRLEKEEVRPFTNSYSCSDQIYRRKMPWGIIRFLWQSKRGIVLTSLSSLRLS